MEALAGVFWIVVIAGLVYWRYRRWRSMTPEQRKIERLEGDVRRLKRDQRRRLDD